MWLYAMRGSTETMCIPVPRERRLPRMRVDQEGTYRQMPTLDSL
jgi:hypothetical protein